jgi:lysyl-tRNA synthetase class II
VSIAGRVVLNRIGGKLLFRPRCGRHGEVQVMLSLDGWAQRP